MLKLNKCSSCYDGKILDKEHRDYDEIDYEIDRLYEGGQFSYYDAFNKVTGRKGGTKKCSVCNGTGKAE